MPDLTGWSTALRDLHTLNVRDFMEEAVRQVPNETFMMYGAEEISYREFKRRVDEAASAWHQLGVRKGDRVAFMLENRPEFLQCWLGLAKIGGILVAINTRWQRAEIEYFLNLSEPRFGLVGEQYRDVFRSTVAAVPTLERVFTFGTDRHFADFSALLKRSSPAPPRIELSADDVISFISTSGTTGRPKAVMQTHGNYVLTGEGYASWVELQPRERIYLCLPLFHINSQAYTVMGAIAARGTIVLVERFSASRFWSDMTEYGVNVFNYIGSMLVVLMKREPSAEERGHAVRLTYGGPALPGPVREEVERRFGFTVISGIGMSETTFGLIEPLHQNKRPGTLGTVRQHPDPRIRNEARVVDDDGLDVQTGEVGELIFRSPVQMKGYYREPGQTANTIRDGWLYTGDLVRQDEDGYFYFVDRKKDIIRVRGENVASSEVEQVLNDHPAVREASVVGVPSELTDEDVAAFVVPQFGANTAAEELIEWCRARLAPFKVPRYLWLVQSLPKTETLRTEKHNLRAEALGRLPASVEAGRGGSKTP
jgi:crotonobetaine/carnitine-CoA ligase